MISLTYEQKKAIVSAFLIFFAIVAVVFFLSEYTDGNSSSNHNSNDGVTINRADYIESCRSYNYKDLMRDPDAYTGKHIYIKGKVVQVMQSDPSSNYYKLVVATSGYGGILYDDKFYVTYTLKSSEKRILEDDNIIFYGDFNGLISRKTVLGESITLPKISAKFMEMESDN